MLAADQAGQSSRSSSTSTTSTSARTCAGSGSATTSSRGRRRRTTARVDARRVPRALGARVPHRADDDRRVLGDDREHAPRPLHRGHVPDLRVRGGARRPVRQLRQPARRRRPDRPALEGRRAARRSSGRRSTSSSTCRSSRSGSTTGSPHRRTGARTSATSPSSYVDELRPRAVTRDLDWGIRVPVPGYEEQETSGSTSGSTPSSATCRRRSSGRRSAASRTPGATGGRTPTRATSTSWARTTSLPHGHLAERAARLRDRRRARRRAEARAPVRRRRLRVPDHGGQQDELEPRRGHPRP